MTARMAVPPMGTPPPATPPPLPWLFFLVAIVMAVGIAAAIAYLGVTGHLGAVIPGTGPSGGGIVLPPLLGFVFSASALLTQRLPP